MVDLYDLKQLMSLRSGDGGGTTTTATTTATRDLDHWPVGGIDEHIAQLEFETSSIANEESLFAEMDPALISTDSLDMEQLRQRCETKKNDYKLTFEDSGQWTTSGFGTSPSGMTGAGGGGAIDDLSSSEEKRQSAAAADLLLNNDANEFPNGTLTTWGRIRSVVEPPFDPKTNSMPSGVAFRHSTNDGKPLSSGGGGGGEPRRPTSLLANFVERQAAAAAATGLSDTPPQDYEYSERYLDDGRYLDLNENEIGYAPASTAPIQRSGGPTPSNSGSTKRPPVPPAATTTGQQQTPTTSRRKDRWQEAHKQQQRRIGSGPPRRTFATLEAGGQAGTAPDLNFLSLPFKVPSVCKSSASLDEIFRHTQHQQTNGAAPSKISASKTEAFLSELLAADTNAVANATARLFRPTCSSSSSSSSGGPVAQSTPISHLTAPDSGLGSSGNQSTAATSHSNSQISNGPAHVEDWPSLSILLPKHVVDVYSFFKSNANLLSNTNSTTNSSAGADNSIERKSRSAAACRTCYGLRSAYLHPPACFAHSQRGLCDCVSVDRKLSSLSAGHRADEERKCRRQAKLRAEELSVIGMPIYDAKRRLVELVVEGVAEMVRSGSTGTLCRALEKLLADGLDERVGVWRMIVRVTRPGKATNSIYALVQTLDAGEKSENSRVQAFFRELLRLNSLDGWLSYTVLKEKQLAEMYADTAFLVRAHTAYRSLFWRLIESLELLSVLTQCDRSFSSGGGAAASAQSPAANGMTIKHSNSMAFDASRLASDSRVPKSSSVPSKLRDVRSLSTDRRKRSRIPVALQCRSRSVTMAASEPPTSTCPLPRSHSSLMTARVRADIVGEGPGGWLPLRGGERVRLLSVRNGWVWCSRSSWKEAIRQGLPINGTVPTEFLEL